MHVSDCRIYLRINKIIISWHPKLLSSGTVSFCSLGFNSYCTLWRIVSAWEFAVVSCMRLDLLAWCTCRLQSTRHTQRWCGSCSCSRWSTTSLPWPASWWYGGSAWSRTLSTLSSPLTPRTTRNLCRSVSLVFWERSCYSVCILSIYSIFLCPLSHFDLQHEILISCSQPLFSFEDETTETCYYSAHCSACFVLCFLW